MRTLAFLIAVMLAAFMMGCGSDEEEESSTPTKVERSEPTLGLHGDTFRNQRYVFKVSNLPVDGWTVLWYPKDREQIGVWFKDKNY